MTMHTTTKPERRVAAIGASLALLTCSLTGCAPDTAPTPTPTPAFASEEEAFAAAEEVYRAYNEALNARNRGESEPDPQQYLTGPALEGELDAQNSLQEWGLHANGEAIVLSFRGIEATTGGPTTDVSAYLCIDVSLLRVVDDTGADVTPAERGDVVSQLVRFTGDRDRLLITHEDSADEASC